MLIWKTWFWYAGKRINVMIILKSTRENTTIIDLEFGKIFNSKNSRLFNNK